MRRYSKELHERVKMDGSISASSGDLVKVISEADKYNTTQISIIFTILFIAFIMFVFKFFVKNTNEVINKNTESQTLLRSTIENTNKINEKILENLDRKLDKDLEMHQKTHESLKDITLLIEREKSGK